MKINLKKIFLILFCFILSNSSNSQGLFFSIEEEMEFVDPLDFNYLGFIELNLPYKKSLRSMLLLLEIKMEEHVLVGQYLTLLYL